MWCAHATRVLAVARESRGGRSRFPCVCVHARVHTQNDDGEPHHRRHHHHDHQPETEPTKRTRKRAKERERCRKVETYRRAVRSSSSPSSFHGSQSRSRVQKWRVLYFGEFRIFGIHMRSVKYMHRRPFGILHIPYFAKHIYINDLMTK